jgi:hypothetical protein
MMPTVISEQAPIPPPAQLYRETHLWYAVRDAEYQEGSRWITSHNSDFVATAGNH